jgi:hypothetical protein
MVCVPMAAPIRPCSVSSRRVWRWMGALALVAACGLLAVSIGLRRYLKSDGFRQLVEREAGRALHGKVELDPLTWQDTTALARQVVVTGGTGAGFTTLEARDLRAAVRIGAVWDRTWHLPRVEADSVVIDISPPPAHSSVLEPLEEAIKSTASAHYAPRWLTGFLPNRLQVDEVVFPRTSLRYAKEGTAFQIEGADVTLRPHGKVLDLAIRGGRGTWNEERKFVLETAQARIADGMVFLTEARGHTTAGGTSFRVTGEAGQRVDLRAVFENMGADELLSEDWRQRLHGKLNGEIAITGSESTGVLALRDGRLELLPLLDRIATHTQNDDFRRLTITRAHTRFRRTPRRLELWDFSLEGPTLRLTGQCNVENGQIDGLLQVGIAPGTLRWVPGAESRVFTRQENGFLWTSMRVAGPTDSPSEDLSPRLVDAAVAQTIEDAPRKVFEAAGKAVDTARDIGSRALDVGERALEKGAGLLKEFVPFFK